MLILVCMESSSSFCSCLDLFIILSFKSSMSWILNSIRVPGRVSMMVFLSYRMRSGLPEMS